jgi:Asp-tRNA(Asn)/Glu-tRNA(Gln) amidotransferase A subunit family amidase
MVDTLNICEITVAELHERMEAGTLTSEALVERYLERIEAYDRNGPALNGVITVNDRAVDRARTLDRRLAEDGFVGPLHGVPLLVKDQVMTADVETTFGSVAFEGYVPPRDAVIVEKLRDAGAIVLAKTNLPDWAAGFVGYSSVQGQTKNPYALDRDSGGSSAGTGAGVAANLGTVGIGEDTGGSIRVPASCCNLYGLRVTTGLISRSGLSPLVSRMDTAGPMARTVADLTRVLDALVGYDSADKPTGIAGIADVASYTAALDADGLDGARIGVLRERFGSDSDPDAAPVNAAVEDALATMVEAGAELVDPVSLPSLERRIEESMLHDLQPKHDIDAFLAGLADAPVDSVEALYEAGAYHERLELFETIAAAPADPTTDVEYWRRVDAQTTLMHEISGLHAEHDLDAIAFPDVQVVPMRYERYHTGEAKREDYPVNTVIASQSSCPALSMPAGFTDDGLPVGIELLGPPFAEPRLLGLASGYEAVADVRRPPETTPPVAE